MVVFKTIVLKNDRFWKLVVSITIVNDDPSLAIFNDYPLLTIFNDEPSSTIVKNHPSLTTTLRSRSLTKRGNGPEENLYLSLSSL